MQVYINKEYRTLYTHVLRCAAYKTDYYILSLPPVHYIIGNCERGQ